jgi:hypothetical protein
MMISLAASSGAIGVGRQPNLLVFDGSGDDNKKTELDPALVYSVEFLAHVSG